MTPPVCPDTMSESNVRKPRITTNERQILTDFLKLYKTFPCLWDQKHMLYSNKEVREKAYEKLLEKYKLYDENGTTLDVKKKIEHMRCAYRREHKKVLMNKFHGTNHKPHLWYYNLLRFLNESRDDDDDQEFKNESNVSMYEDSYQDNTQEMDDSDEEETKPKRRKKSNNSNTIFVEEHLQNVEEYLEPEILEQEQNHVEVVSHPYIINSEAEAFGRTVGFQLKELTNMQRILAEKLISDVIFQGRLGKLSVDTAIND